MKSVLRSLQVLELVSEHQPVGLGELCRMVDVPKSTLQRTLLTLHEAGWLRPARGEDNMKWEVGTRVLQIRPRALREGHLHAVAREPMIALRDATNETVHLSIPDGIECMVLIDRADCAQSVRTFSPLGDKSPMHATATGRAVLAHLSAADIDAVIRNGLTAYSDTTPRDETTLREELTRIRQTGYSLNLGGYRPAVCAIGAPIFDSEHRPVAAICISMPESRYDDAKRDEWADLVRRAAEAISSGPADRS